VLLTQREAIARFRAIATPLWFVAAVVSGVIGALRRPDAPLTYAILGFAPLLIGGLIFTWSGLAPSALALGMRLYYLTSHRRKR